MIGFPDRLVHGYGVIKNEIAWDILGSKLSALLGNVNKLLGDRRPDRS
ncbi:MAG: DUF86 domain-containing protein [Phycisphaerae bacterium]|nr:DUF86 domain-containing protein [Phycisphaerae bacterium]